MCKNTKKIKRIIATILTVALVVNNDFSGFFTVKAREQQNNIERSVSDNDVIVDTSVIQPEENPDEGESFPEVQVEAASVSVKSDDAEINALSELSLSNNYTLDSDMAVSDLVISDGALDLNGHTLTVKGELIQAGGMLDVNGGQLIVEGDYRIQSRSGAEGSYTYNQSTGILKMQNKKDYVLVKGSFFTSANVNTVGYLTDGILEIKGNFTQCSTSSLYSFVASDDHTLLLSGTEKQTVLLDNNKTLYSGFANLDIQNTSKDGIAFEGTVYALGEIKQNGCSVSGILSVGETTVFSENEYSGNIRIATAIIVKEDIIINGDVTFSSKVSVPGNLVINGNVTLEEKIEIAGKVIINGNLEGSNLGYIYMQGGSLYVYGDLNMSAAYNVVIYMADNADYIYVEGTFDVDFVYLPTLSAGIIEVGGNFFTDSYFCATGNHKVILSGSQEQTVKMGSGAYFATLELCNDSETGVCASSALLYDTLIKNESNLWYGNADRDCYTLEQNEIYEGDLILEEDTLDLNGYTLTVNGDLIQAGGVLNINGGKLVVEGDYRLQEKTYSSYRSGWGTLIMQNEQDYVFVKGNFYAESTRNHTGYLTNGVLEVKGDVTLISPRSYDEGFVATGNHTLLLSGDKKQTIEVDAKAQNGTKLANLEILHMKGGSVDVGSNTYVSGQVKQNGCKVDGTLMIGNTTTFYGGEYSGDVQVVEAITIREKLTIKGNVTYVAPISIIEELDVDGNLNAASTTSYIHMDGGSLYVSGCLGADENSVYGLKMEKEEDYIYVGGDFNIVCNDASALCEGILEVAGNFSASGKFSATGDHRVVLSGSKGQKINVGENVRFATLELSNHSEEGVYCDGDLVFIGGTLDLNGLNLSVKGDFIHANGKVNIDGGKLIVDGDYHLQKKDGDKYLVSTGTLVMQKENDYVLIKGSLYADTEVDHTEYLTNGILEIKGSFANRSSSQNVSFTTTEKHTLLLSGNEEQKLYASNNARKYNSIANLEMRNTSRKGVFFDSMVCILGEIRQNDTRVSGIVEIGGSSYFYDNRYEGSVRVISDKHIDTEITINGTLYLDKRVTVSEKLVVNGNLIMSGYNSGIYMNSGTLYVSGDYKANSYGHISMTNSTDYIYVGGDFNLGYNLRSCTLTEGTLEVAGDFAVNGGFVAGGNHRTVLSGSQKQTIKMGEGSCFAHLELRNYSEEGVYALQVISYTILTKNGCPLKYGECEGQSGWKLETNEVYEGDLIMTGGTLDLNGKSLIIKGDLIQISGTVNINGGELIVEGDYRLQTRTGTEDAYTYNRSDGCLKMQDEKDYVLVKGGFYTQTSADHRGYLTNGVLEVKGDFTQLTTSVQSNFPATEEHTLLLSGNGKQTIAFWNNKSYDSGIANLELANGSEEGVVFGKNVYVEGQIKQNNTIVKGNVEIGGNVNFCDEYKGDVSVVSDVNLDGSSTVTGVLEVKSPTKISGNMTIIGDVYVKSTLEASGELNIHGNVDVRSAMNGNINIAGQLSVNARTEIDGNVIVNGDVSAASEIQVNGNMTVEGDVGFEEWIEIKGSLTIKGNVTNTGDCSYVSMKGGSLYVYGNLTIHTNNWHNGLCMENDSDYVYVDGNFCVDYYTDYEYYEWGNIALSNGRLEVVGNFTTTGDFCAMDNHKVILSGDKKQVVSIEKDSYFATLELRNYSEEGVYSEKALMKKALIRNGCNLKYGDAMGVYGWTLTKDEVYEGDLILFEDTLNLNGYVLTIKGDFVHAGGAVDVNGGVTLPPSLGHAKRKVFSLFRSFA